MKPLKMTPPLAKRREDARKLIRQILVDDFHQKPTKRLINEVAEKLVKQIAKVA